MSEPNAQIYRDSAFVSAEFEVQIPLDWPVTLYFAHDPAGPFRGGSFEIVGVQAGAHRFVTKGICNYVPIINAMKELKRGSAERQSVMSRIEAAREELRQAEIELEKLT